MKSCSYNLATPFIIDTSMDSMITYVDMLSRYGRRYMRRSIRDYNDNCQFVKSTFSPAMYGKSRPARPQHDITNIQPSSVDCMLKYLRNRDMYHMYTVYRDEQPLGYIFLKIYGDFAVSSCPITVSNFSNEKYFSYFIWYKIIETCIKSPDIKWLNLGESKSWISEFSGRKQPTWSYMLSNRQKKLTEWDNINNSSFFLFIPKQLKSNPSTANKFIIVQCNMCKPRGCENLHDISDGPTCVCTECGYSHNVDISHIVL